MSEQRVDLTRDQKIASQKSKIEALRESQILEATGAKEPELVPANRNPKFKIRKIEADGYVHVFTRVRNLDQAQKNFINEDRIIVIHARDFDRKVNDGMFKTYDLVEVIHDPRKGAPKSYDLKPEAVSVDKPAKSSIDPKLAERERQIEQAEAELAAREKALAEKEAAIKAAQEKAAAEQSKDEDKPKGDKPKK